MQYSKKDIWELSLRIDKIVQDSGMPRKDFAEFELEDGDTMPEHMDLEYKGAKIDFHCRPMWIPCCETVDIPDHEILACDKYGEMMFGYLAYEDEQWLCASDGCVMYDPIAWREKPEPYREEGEE